MSVVAPEFDPVWQWDGWTTADETAYAGAVDSDGNVITVGVQGREIEEDFFDDTFVDTESGDFAAVKLSSSGEVLWTWTASSSDAEGDTFYAVDTDSNNDVVIGGNTNGNWDETNPNNAPDLAVVKLSASGEELWRYQESPLDTSSTTFSGDVYTGKGSVYALAVDGDNNVLLAGQTIGALVAGEGTNQDSDAYVIKLDGTDGSEIWRAQAGESSSFDGGEGVTVDAAGDVITVAISGDEDAINFLALKLSGLDGTVLWEYSPVTSFSIDVPSSVVVDAQGDVYVCGGYDSQNLQGDIAETPVVLKLSGATGDVIWTYEGTATSRAIFYGVAIDPMTGWIAAAGRTEGTWVTGAAAGGYDFAAVLLDGDGNELSRYQDGTAEDDYFAFAGFDSAGGLFLGGSAHDGGEEEFVVIKFAPFEAAGATLAPSPQPTASPLLRSPAPMDATLAPLASATLPPASPAPVGDNASPAPARTPSPSPGSRGGIPIPTPAPSLAPTSAAAAAAVLAEWEIGAIVGGGAFFLLLLGLCLFCCRRKRSKDQQEPPKDSSRSLPVETFGGLAAVQNEPPRAQSPPPEKVMAAAGTPVPVRSPPPVYCSPARPQPEAGELPPPPAYVEMNPTEPPAAAPPAETALQRLANRVQRVPSKKVFDQNYRDIPVSQYGPYAPAPPKR